MSQEPRPKTVFDDEDTPTARSYAEALINASAKTGETEAVVAELEELQSDLFGPSPQFAHLLASASVPAADKDRILDEAFGGRALPTVVRFLKVLNRHGRLGLLAPITRETRLIWDKKLNRKPVTVRTAIAVDDDQKHGLESRIAAMIGGTPLLRYEVDPSLIGGIVVQVGDDLYDASLKTRLEKMQRDLVSGKAREHQSRREFISL